MTRGQEAVCGGHWHLPRICVPALHVWGPGYFRKRRNCPERQSTDSWHGFCPLLGEECWSCGCQGGRSEVRGAVLGHGGGRSTGQGNFLTPGIGRDAQDGGEGFARTWRIYPEVAYKGHCGAEPCHVCILGLVVPITGLQRAIIV